MNPSFSHIKASENRQTTCCYCGVGCGIQVKRDNLNRISLEGDKDHPVNKGMLCSKGMNLHYTVNDTSDRLLYPEMRYSKNLPRQRVSWDTALERTAAVFKTMIQKYGPDSVAFYVSGQCLTEEYYVINKLIKGFIGSNNIDTNSRLCMSSAVVAYKMSLGEDSVPICYEDLELADVIFVAGANPAWCHPILWRRIEIAKEKNPALKIIVSDPRNTASCLIADIHLQLNPGTDIILHHAIGRCLIESGQVDNAFIKNNTEGFDAYKQNVFKRSIEEAALLCGLTEESIRQSAFYIAQAKGFVSMWTMGLNQSVIGVHKNLSLINLHLITGQIGKAGSGPFSLTGQPNAMGGREVGGLSNLLPAHRNLSNENHRQEVESFWKIPLGSISPKAGYTATEMFDALNREELKAIWIICTNPLISLPDVRKAEAGLQKAKYVVVQDISNKAETLKYADVVLPAAGWLEKEGTMTNAERRISYLSKAIEAPGEALPDAEIICRFAKKMNFLGFDYKNTSEIYDEHAALTKNTHIDISGLNYDTLISKKSVQWPYLKVGHDLLQDYRGTERLFIDKKFYTPSLKAIIHSFPDENKSPAADSEFPLILTTGRIRDQWHTMSRTGKVNKLKQHASESFLEIHPEDAASRNINDENLVEIKSVNGTIRVKAHLTKSIKPGLCFLPMHWGKILDNDLNRANNLTNNLVDPFSKEPDFKFTPIEVKKYKKPKQKIIIVGGGAGAFGFVKSYRSLNTSDEIEVFSNEDCPFYNRVLLPDYINGHHRWEDLIKMEEAEEKSAAVLLHRGSSITSIDRKQKKVTDHHAKVHSYDLLILATGSRAASLRDLPSMEGIFTMRNKSDADRFINHIQGQNAPIVIIGGGLLGIELAAALNQIGRKVTIVQRIARLMDRQLDPLGSQLLHEELIAKGIEIYYNDEIDRFLGDLSISGIVLKSGMKINTKAVIIAIGTIPNIELAQKDTIDCKRGVLVNEYLQTNDPSIFALGEIAEFKHTLYGITAAAEAQATCLARYISGDIAACYQGSLFMNILKIQGTDLCSLGIVEYPEEDPAYEEIIFLDKAKRYYKKCIIYQDRLVGAILIGDKSEFLEFRNLIENKLELSEKRIQLLRSGKTMEPVLGKLICSCNNVGEGNLINKIDAGCTDHLQLCQLTGAGMGCGSCRPEIKNILEHQKQSKKELNLIEA